VIDDPYVDADTGVLVNLLGLSNRDDLNQAEADIVTARLIQVQRHRVHGNYDVAHLKAFHRHLFGDVYGWAGDFRTVNIALVTPFGDWRFVRLYLDGIFVDLAAEHHLRGLAKHELVSRLAHFVGEINAAHPFREGNGRTQRAFFGQLAADAGWSLRWSHVSADENAIASHASLGGDLKPMERLLAKAISTLSP
jgi:cell filamentation protein